MTYIYDIYLNFQKEIIEFFEWEKEDKIINIKKIPLYKITTKELKKIIHYKCKIFNINEIENKTIIKGKDSFIKQCCLLTDGEEVLAIRLNKNKEIYKYSKLLLDEEQEVREISKLINATNLKLDLLCRKNINFFTSKNKKEEEKNIINFLYLINKEKLKYIHYEYFKNIKGNLYNNLTLELTENYNEFSKFMTNIMEIILVDNV